jgi:drug/metabolite transporter (DMT)-like permease
MAPFTAAALDRIIRAEPIRPAVMRSALVSALGVGVIVIGGLGGGQAAGDLMAVAMLGLFSLYIVLIRAFPGAPAMRAAALSSVFPVVAGLMLGAPVAVSPQDMALLVAFGLSFALANIAFTEGARRIPAAEAGLYGGLEVPVAVVLAGLVLGEAPPAATLAGGGLVMAAVVWRGLADLRR